MKLAVFCFLLWAAVPPPQVVDGYMRYVEALLDLQLDSAQQARLRADVKDYYTRQDRKAIQIVEKAAQDWLQLQQQDPQLVATAMTMTRPDALLSLADAAKKGEADSRFLLDAYYAAHPILAAGKPGGLPLTRDAVAGDLEVKRWHATEILRQRVPTPNLDAALQAAIQEHPQLNPAQQVALARQSGEWARIRYAWPRASAMDRLLTRAELGGPLDAHERQAIQQFQANLHSQLNGMLSQHQNAMLQSTVQNMKQNSETIMGRGTVWNPATNRWEQQGGIVTEFNGVVRVP